MAQSRKRTLAGQCPRPVQGGPSPPAALGFSAALADSHRVWRGTPVWSGLLGLLCFVLQTLSSRLWSWCAACTHSWSGAPGDVLSLVLLDMLSTSWGLGKAWVSHFFFFFPPLVRIWKNPKTMTQEPSLGVSHGTLYPPLEKACPRKRGHSLNS